jgi:hypothetical protein
LYAEMMDYGLNVRELEDNYFYQLDSWYVSYYYNFYYSIFYYCL